jgi:hypothetical protein
MMNTANSTRNDKNKMAVFFVNPILMKDLMRIYKIMNIQIIYLFDLLLIYYEYYI